MTSSVATGELGRPGALRVPEALLVPPKMPRLYFWAVLDWGWIGLFWAGLWLTPLWLAPLWMLLVAGRFHAFGVILHDLIHLPMEARKTWAQRGLELLVAYPIAMTAEAFRVGHIQHHRWLGTEQDPYFQHGIYNDARAAFGVWIRQTLAVPAWLVRAPWGVMAVYVPAMRPLYGRIFHQDKTGRDLTNDAALLRAARDELGLCVFYLLAFGLTLAFPWPMLLGYWIPLELAWLLGGARFLLEHTYEPGEAAAPETVMRTTYDHHLGWLGRALLAPHNVGYHIVHHIHPNVGFEHVPALRDWYREHWGGDYPPPRETRAAR